MFIFNELTLQTKTFHLLKILLIRFSKIIQELAVRGQEEFSANEIRVPIKSEVCDLYCMAVGLVHRVVACNDPAIRLSNQEMQRDNPIRTAFSMYVIKTKSPWNGAGELLFWRKSEY
jgi:hypothetical protein